VFFGAYEHTVDDKGRTVMPARLRQQLGEKFVITRGVHGCLWVFSEKGWPQVQEKLSPKGLLDVEGIRLERYFLGAASECIPDRQGRIALPPILAEYAGIKDGDTILIIGLTNRVEVWSKPRWVESNSKVNDDFIADLGREVGDPR